MQHHRRQSLDGAVRVLQQVVARGLRGLQQPTPPASLCLLVLYRPDATCAGRTCSRTYAWLRVSSHPQVRLPALICFRLTADDSNTNLSPAFKQHHAYANLSSRFLRPFTIPGYPEARPVLLFPCISSSATTKTNFRSRIRQRWAFSS